MRNPRGYKQHMFQVLTSFTHIQVDVPSGLREDPWEGHRSYPSRSLHDPQGKI